mgnify:CR=1 FL=1
METTSIAVRGVHVVRPGAEAAVDRVIGRRDLSKLYLAGMAVGVVGSVVGGVMLALGTVYGLLVLPVFVLFIAASLIAAEVQNRRARLVQANTRAIAPLVSIVPGLDPTAHPAEVVWKAAGHAHEHNLLIHKQEALRTHRGITSGPEVARLENERDVLAAKVRALFAG